MFILIFCFFVKKFIINSVMGCFQMCKDCCCPREVGVEDVIVAEQSEEIGYYWDSLTGDD